MAALRLPSLCLISLSLTLAACSSLPSWMGGTKKEEDKLPGERLAVLAERDTTLQADSSLAGTPIELPAAAPIESWPEHGGNGASAVGHPKQSGNLSSRASARIGKGNAFTRGFAIAPVTGGGSVFAMDSTGAVSAHDANNVSSVRWVSPGVADKDEDEMLGGGLAYDNGVVYAVSGRGLVAAFKAEDGSELWRQPLNIPVRSAPKIVSSRLFIVTIDSQMFSLNARDGSVLWNHRGIDEGASFLSHASPSLARDVVAAPYSSGEIYVLSSETGKEIWADSLSQTRRTNATGLFSDIGSDPVIVGNALYVVSNAGILGAYRLDNGQRVWEQTVSSPEPLWVAGNAVFLITPDAVLMALNRMDGRVYWTAPLPRYKNEDKKIDPYHWSGPVLASGKIYVAGANGELRVFSAMDGKAEPVISIPDGVFSAPVLSGNAMYLVTQDSTLHALR